MDSKAFSNISKVSIILSNISGYHGMKFSQSITEHIQCKGLVFLIACIVYMSWLVVGAVTVLMWLCYSMYCMGKAKANAISSALNLSPILLSLLYQF